MKAANPATQRKALEFAHELAKWGVPMVVIPLLNDQQRDRLTVELASALAEFEALGAAGEFAPRTYQPTEADRRMDEMNLE